MRITKHHWIIFAFNILYIVGFTAYYISIKNFEFLWYVGVMVFFVILIGTTLKRSKFDYLILWALSLWGFLHMAGGGIKVGGDVLYALPLWQVKQIGDTYIFKFDQLVHAYGFATTTLVAWHLLKPYLNHKTNYAVIYPILVVVSMGLGSLNEIVEFIAVVSFPQTGVGGYYNTALDMVANTFGAVAGVLVVHKRRKT